MAKRSSAVALWCLALLWASLCSQGVWARDVYVRAGASAGGNGSAAAPFGALAQLGGVLDQGDRVFLGGMFRGESLALDGTHDVTFDSWPGEAARPSVRGDVPIAAFAWVFDASVHAHYAAMTAEPLQVVWNWDLNVDASGRHYGFMRRAASLDALRPGGWWWDGASRLYIKPPAGALSPNPASGADSYGVLHAGNAFRFANNPVGVTLRNIDVALWAYKDETLSGYGVRMEGATGCVVEMCTFTDCGKHSVGFVGLGSADNVMRSLVCRGLQPDCPSGEGHLVFYSYENDISGCVAEDCELHLYTHLDCDGASAGGSANGCFVHSDASARVLDVKWKRIRCIDYRGNTDVAFGVGRSTPLPADRGSMNPAEYPVRFIECSLRNGTAIALGSDWGGVAASFERCVLEFTNPAPDNPWVIEAQGSDARALFESCVIVVDASAMTSSESRVFDVPPWSSVMLNGCVVHIAGALGSNCAHIRQNLSWDPPAYPNSMIVARQTVFSRETPGALHKGNNFISQGNLARSLDLKDCWYWNIAPGQFSLGIMAAREQSNWTQMVDWSGVYGVDPQFEDANGRNFEAGQGSPMRSLVLRSGGAARPGINRRPFSGHFGAYQYGPECDFDGDALLGARDLALLLSAWGRCGDQETYSPRDLNGDGLVNAVDLATLLSIWSNALAGARER